MRWPDGKQFAFTIFDDTDLQTLDNVPAVYDFLDSLGFRTTKSVWPNRGSSQPKVGGLTCEDPDYVRWVTDLQRRGFEIGMHNATYHTSTRDQTRQGIERFRELFGCQPATLANHVGCRESLYWGEHRLTGIHQPFYRILTRKKKNREFAGHIQGHSLFWGDVCREQVKYVRNFVYPGMNTLKACPMMPYHDRLRPYVRYWFASSEGAKVDSFVKTISESNQDRLEAEGGGCIMYTHLACGFYRHGELDSRFKTLMQRLSQKNGWFVPVVTLLDYLRGQNGRQEITDRERSRLERKWLLHKILSGGTS